jgi:aspartate racemase
MAKQMIGILGGMGPEASSYFYHLLIEIAQEKYKAVQDTDYPPMVIYNMPLNDFDETGIVDAESVKAQLVEGVKKLEEFGAKYIVIACNTVHQFYEEMQRTVSVPIINIVTETAAEAARRGYKNVLLLSSESTNREGLYKQACKNAGVASVSVNDSDQAVLNEIILHVMAGTQGTADVRAVDAIIGKLEGPADAVLLGCTELPLAVREGDLDVPVLNSNRIVLEAVLAKVYA